jgi:hypothetical protein
LDDAESQEWAREEMEKLFERFSTKDVERVNSNVKDDAEEVKKTRSIEYDMANPESQLR